MNRVDDTCASSGEAAVNRLRVFEIRIHARRIVDEPGSEVQRGAVGIALVVRDLPRRAERGHFDTQTHQGLAMLDEIIGIGHPIALDVGAAGIFRVGPPVVAFREKVVQPARATRRMRSGHGDGLVGEIRVGGFDDAGAIEFGDVELLGAEGQRRGEEHHTSHKRWEDSRITSRDGMKMRFISAGVFASMHSHNSSAAVSPMVELLWSIVDRGTRSRSE
jgi:hypothetical protein